MESAACTSPAERLAVAGVLVVGVEHRQVPLAQVQQLGRRAEFLGRVEGDAKCLSRVAVVAEAPQRATTCVSVITSPEGRAGIKARPLCANDLLCRVGYRATADCSTYSTLQLSIHIHSAFAHAGARRELPTMAAGVCDSAIEAPATEPPCGSSLR